MSDTVPTNAEMVTILRRAIHDVVSRVASGEFVQRLQVGSKTIEEADPDKLLARLQTMLTHYEGKTAVRRSYRMGARR